MRLPQLTDHLFSGHQVDRDKPVTFRLNGIPVQGYEGDTVLSALLADGIMAAGTYSGALMGLDENLDLPIHTEGATYDPLPISRTPALNGVHYLTEPDRRVFNWPRLPAWLDMFRPRNLKADFKVPLNIPGPWIETPDVESLNAGCVIIGGGVAGLAAAVELGRAGRDVILLERRGYCGGDAPLFGRAEGEEVPEEVITNLREILNGLGTCQICHLTEALTLEANTIQAHQVFVLDGRVRARLLKIEADNIVIATGCAETLPVLPGNRLPGISGFAAIYHLASAYGVVLSQTTTIATATNVGYRLALLMKDAGIDVSKIADSRLSPQSRFIEFSKAYGIKFEFALRARTARSSPRKNAVELDLASSWDDEGISKTQPLSAGSILLSGGWQPRLGLWQQAGGKVELDRDRGRISAVGQLDKIHLAGSCAGVQSLAAVIRSGKAAATAILEGNPKRVAERPIDSAFETPDDKLAITDVDTETPAFLSNGPSLVAREGQPAKVGFAGLLGRRPDALSAAERALGLGDLIALQLGGDTAATDFDALVHERAIVSRSFKADPTTPPKPAESSEADSPLVIPPYLQGRFGKGAICCRIKAAESGTFETGNLIYSSSDASEPDFAVGVILKSAGDSTAFALITKGLHEPGRHVTVRTSGAQIAAILGEKA